MDITIIIKEFLRMLKEHIVFVCSVILLCVLASFLWITMKSKSQDTKDYAYLAEIFSQEPATFQVTILTEDGNHYGNATIFDEFFATEDMVEEISRRSGVDIQSTLTAEKNLELLKDQNYRGSIGALRDAGTGIFTFRFLVTNSAADNLKVAQAYYDLLHEADFPLLFNKKLIDINPPKIGEIPDIDLHRELPTLHTLDLYAGIGLKYKIAAGIASVIIGFILASGVLILWRLIASDIRYAFEYMVDYRMSFLYRVGISELNPLILLPVVNRQRLVIAQEVISDVETVSSVMDWSPLEAVNELVLVIQAGRTSKAWYREQRQLLSLMDQPVCVVHYIEKAGRS